MIFLAIILLVFFAVIDFNSINIEVILMALAFMSFLSGLLPLAAILFLIGYVSYLSHFEERVEPKQRSGRGRR